MKVYFLSIIMFSFIISFSNTRNVKVISDDSLNYSEFISVLSDTIICTKEKARYFTRKRFVAIALAILTGPLGGHRLYLGTNAVVPVCYTLTLGGGFVVLPAIDLILIIFTKDLSKFENNDRVIMWLNADK